MLILKSIKNYYYIFSNIFYSMATKMVRWDPYLEPAGFHNLSVSRIQIRNSDLWISNTAFLTSRKVKKKYP